MKTFYGNNSILEIKYFVKTLDEQVILIIKFENNKVNDKVNDYHFRMTRHIFTEIGIPLDTLKSS